MEKILTISVAAYNVEQYIRQSLDSLCVESILPYIEVFIVDDGGKDNTLSIAKEYQRKYPDTFIAVHKENGGWGSTVNYSIQHATGKYFKLLDGDDYFDKAGLAKLVETLKHVDADAIYTPYRTFDDESGEKLELFTAPKEIQRNTVIGIKNIGLSTDFITHSSTFRTAILKDNHVSVLEHCFYTDAEYRTKAFVYVNDAYITDIEVYQYRIGRDGQSVSINGLKKHYKDFFYVLQEMIDLIDVPQQNKEILLKHAKYVVQIYYGVLLRLGYKKEMQEFDAFLKLKDEKLYPCDMGLIRLLRKTNFKGFWFCVQYTRFRAYLGAIKAKIIRK